MLINVSSGPKTLAFARIVSHCYGECCVSLVQLFQVGIVSVMDDIDRSWKIPSWIEPHELMIVVKDSVFASVMTLQLGYLLLKVLIPSF